MSGTAPTVCYFRGSYLNPFETQYLKPLTDRFAISVAHSRSLRYDVSAIALPKIRVNCVDYLNGLIPRRIRGHQVPNILKAIGCDDMILGGRRIANNFDIVHVAEQVFFSTWQLARAKRSGKFSLIVMQDEINPFWYSSNPLVRRRAEYVRSAADLFIARSRACHVCTDMRRRGRGSYQGYWTTGSMSTISVRVPRDEELCRSLGIDPGRFVILFVGNLLWTKGIFSIATAAKLLLQDYEIRRLDPLFLIVGQGGELGTVKKLLRTLGVESSFHFLGQQSYSRLPAIHRIADIFVLPSISTRTVLEQFGIAIIESMATAKPVVSTYCGAIDEVVSDAGLLVQRNDYFRLSEALSRLVKDETLQRTLGERARRRATERFSSAVISERIEAVYREVLAK